MDDDGSRNLRMAERISAMPVRYPFSFVIAGDSGAWPDPTADAIFAQLLRQAGELQPAPVFFANLGDFAGPGTLERHRRYLELVAPLPMPNVCLIGNHDLEDARRPAGVDRCPRAAELPLRLREHALRRDRRCLGAGRRTRRHDAARHGRAERRSTAVLDDTLAATSEPERVVLLHAPPHLDGHYAPQPECGFRQGEPEFLDIIRRHGVKLVCCAHGLGFDHHVRDGIRFVMSGGGGAALYLSYRDAGSRDRGALFHAVEITLAEDGAVRGRVLQAFAPPGSQPPFSFERLRRARSRRGLRGAELDDLARRDATGDERVARGDPLDLVAVVAARDDHAAGPRNLPS